MLKASVGDSLSVGTQQDALYKQLLSDKQKWLAGEFSFPFLKTRWNVTMVAGTRFYSFPTTTDVGTANISIDFERPYKAYVSWTNQWLPVEYGTDEEDFNYLTPETIGGWSQQPMDPVQRWRETSTGSFEVWPVPTSTQIFRFVGQRILGALVATSDTADLDDQFLVLSVAVDVLSKRGGKDVQAKVAVMSARLRAIRQSYSVRGRDVTIRGAVLARSGRLRRIVPVIAVHG